MKAIAKLNLFFLLLILCTFISCQKEAEDYPLVSQVPEPIARYCKEMIVVDSTQINVAFLLISSNDQDYLNQFVENYDFVLNIRLENQDYEFNYNANLQSSHMKELAENTFDSGYNLDRDPEIFLEIVSYNIDKNIEVFYLDIKPKELKSDWIISPSPIAFVTSQNFIGVTHSGGGRQFLYQYLFKRNWWNSWTTYTSGGNNAWFLYPGSSPYAAYFDLGDFYRRQIIVHQHYLDYIYNIVNYRFAERASEFYGRTCSYIGNYDGWSCYVGHPPSGTQAFMWPSNNPTHFYYTPTAGNNCPLQGSSFDGVNCKYLSIPSQTKPFIWNNGWYVYPDLLLN